MEALVAKVDITCGVLCEIGPHPALGGCQKQNRAILSNKLAPCLASLVRGHDALSSILALVGNLFLKNANIDLVAINAVDVFQGG